MKIRLDRTCHFCANGGEGKPLLTTIESPAGIVRICQRCAIKALRMLTKRAAPKITSKPEHA